MARIKLPLPECVLFETTMSIRIGDLNYGAHMGNDAILTLAHEARVLFFESMSYSEMDIEGLGSIIADASVVYLNQAFHKDQLCFKIGVNDLNPYGFDCQYSVIKQKDGKEIARIKTGHVFFDYATQKIAKMPQAFGDRIKEMSLQRIST